MRICYLMRTYPPRLGGPGSITYKISRELVKRGFEITIITQKTPDTPKYEYLDGIKIHRVYSGLNETTATNLSLSLLFFLKKIASNLNQVDIFHAMDISLGGASGCIMKCLSSKPFFLRYGGHLIFEYLSMRGPKGWRELWGIEEALRFDNWRVSMLKTIEKFYMKKYNLLLPDSYYGRELLIREGASKDKVKLLLNGVDTERFRQFEVDGLKTKLGIRESVILVSSRIIPLKGVDVAIRAMEHLKNSKLVVIGTGSDLEKNKILAKELGVENKVLFVGKVAPDEIPSYLNLCDIFLVPSYSDLTPNSLLEAMSCEKPVIVSDVPGLNDVIGDAGIKIPAGDHKSLATAIDRLLSNKQEATKMGREGRKIILNNFSWGLMIKNYVDLYKKWS